MNLIRRFLFFFLSGWLSGIAIADQSLDVHAYYRSGIAFSKGMTDGVCFRLPDWPSTVPRFGNECGQYSEILLKQNYSPGTIRFRGHLTFAFSSDGNSSVEDTAGGRDDLVVAHREAYVEAIGLMGKNTSLWVGKRFYRGYYIEMWDSMLTDHNGSGFGIEHLDLGFGKANFALLRHFSQEQDAPVHTVGDIQISDIRIAKGLLGGRFLYGVMGERGRKTGDKLWHNMQGQQLTLHFHLGRKEWVSNSYLQFGVGLYGGRPEADVGHQTGSTFNQFTPPAFAKSVGIQARENADAWQKSSTLNWIQNITLFPNSTQGLVDLSLQWMQVDFGLRRNDEGTVIPKRTTFAAGLRPVIFHGKLLATDAEIYYASIQNGLPRQPFSGEASQNTITRNLFKTSLGLVIRPEPIYTIKPQIRFYGTYATWNQAQLGDQKITQNSQVYENETEGFTFGVMCEVWW